ncbi:MAG: CRISPR-associated helicase Cas3' [Candidatus Nitrosotenuis sp.]
MLSVYTEFLSHPIEQERHSLLEHLITVAKRSEEIFLQTRFTNSKIAFYSGLLHDIGKLNPFYQILFNETSNRAILEKQLLTKYFQAHAPLSAWAADKLLSKDIGLDNNAISKILVLIYGHHSRIKRILGEIKLGDTFIQSKNDMVPNLVEFAMGASTLKEFAGLNWDRCMAKFKNPVYFDVTLRTTKETAIDSFLEMLMAFSCLLQADRGSFSEYEKVKFDLEINTMGLKTNTKLAQLRTEFQNQVIENFDNNEPVIVINAPTGIGKTKVFLDLISKYRNDEKVERIFYFSPLLALTDDFEKKLALSIPDKEDRDQVLTYNHIFAGSIEEKKTFETGKREQTKWSFPIESFNKKFIITTTQRLLMTLYSNKSRENLKFASFRDSILIIDEVQTIPKYLLANLKKIFLKLNQYMGTKTILVSATIPHEISDLKRINISDVLLGEYLDATRKLISFEKTLDLQKIPLKRTLVMANTRKKAANLFSQLAAIHQNQKISYLSTGIIKKDRKKILEDIANSDNLILVSTQVVEAGVDISFSHVYRETAPLDSIVQVMGRLNREGIEPDARLVVYESDGSYRPYSELEFIESQEQIKKISDSRDLYAILPKYYEKISVANRTYAKKLEELENHIERMDFEGVWDFVNRHVFLDDEKDTVFIPDMYQWDEVKEALVNGLPKDAYKKFGDLTASIPSGINLSVGDFFDDVLIEKNILLPKKDRLAEIYDQKLGLDKWLVTN